MTPVLVMLSRCRLAFLSHLALQILAGIVTAHTTLVNTTKRHKRKEQLNTIKDAVIGTISQKLDICTVIEGVHSLEGMKQLIGFESKLHLRNSGIARDRPSNWVFISNLEPTVIALSTNNHQE
jgi:hypothetical protein